MEHFVTMIGKLVLTVFILSSSSSSSSSVYNDDVNYIRPGLYFPGLNHESYAVLGDINIGGLFAVTDKPSTGFWCSKNVRPDLWVLQYMEAVAAVVRWINEDPYILPNVTLGFAILDYCRNNNIALAQCLWFLPLQKDTQCDLASCNGSSSLSTSSSPSSNSSEVKPRHFDVIGVLAPLSSPSSIAVSSVYSVAQLPMVSYMATNDDLSDKSVHPYFMRVIPPDKLQVLAMLTFISHNRWSYISVVYSEGPYGEAAFRTITDLAPTFNICIATSNKITSKSDNDQIMADLLTYPKARVVLMFTGTTDALQVFAASKRVGARGEFIWLCPDAVSDKLIPKGENWEEMYGTFTFMYYSKRVPNFEDFFFNLTFNSTSNPWTKGFWEAQGQCSFEQGDCDLDKILEDFRTFGVPNTVSLVMDSVLTFALATHKLLSDVCPGVTGKNARDCVNGDMLLKYMMNSSFDGFTGKIEFDAQGNLIGKYEIRQMQWENMEWERNGSSSSKGRLLEIPVALYETSSGNITYTENKISWDHILQRPRLVDLRYGLTSPDVPESECSRPCDEGEYMIQKQLVCCWDCRRCRDNERLVRNNTGCEMCEEFTWPDPQTKYTTCLSIPPSFSSIPDTLSVIQVCLAVMAMICQVLVVVAYIRNRDNRVIKAASRELSTLQMVAIFVGYITVIYFQTRPNHVTCAFLYFMFCLSFALLYSPLIVKAIRIYRIFRNSSKFNRRPRFISPQSQIVMAGIFIGIQVLLCLVTYILYTPTARKTQPVLVEKYVELSCDMTLPGLGSFLTYNLFLVSLCSVFAFKTRKLPDNFNESRFMSMCVSTTLVIWLAFVPTYFTASREHVRTMLLSVALLLNHSVALVFLFLPKIYAAMCIPSENVVVTRFATNTLTQNPGPSNRIAPVSSQTKSFQPPSPETKT